MGMPMPSSGNFADVYKVHCPATGNTWAVKCFTREVAGLKDRYRGISEHSAEGPVSASWSSSTTSSRESASASSGIRS